MPTQCRSPMDITKPGKAAPGHLDLDLDDIEGVVEIFIDSDDCQDDDCLETSTSGAVFSSANEVFVVRYTLLPRGADQQLSFKYEPPSPKFSGSRPSCISYRIQLLHGSQFLYSLRGLPKVLRCQRSANALEWGQVHLVFAAAADLDTFIATLKYVEVEEMAPGEEGQQHGAAEGDMHRHTSGSAATTAGASAARAGAGGRSSVVCGCGAPWPSAAAKLWKDGSRGQGMAAAAASGSCACRSHGSPMFAATAGTAMLAAVAAACLLTQRGASSAPLGKLGVGEPSAKATVAA